MVGRTMIKGLVVVALTSQMAFGASYYEAAKNTVKDAASAVSTAAVNVAKKGYNASKDAAVYAGQVVAAKAHVAGKALAKKAHNAHEVISTAAGHIRDGFVKAGMSLTEGPLKVWADHRDACIAGLTLTGVAATYAIYKYRKACAVQRQIEELKKQQA